MYKALFLLILFVSIRADKQAKDKSFNSADYLQFLPLPDLDEKSEISKELKSQEIDFLLPVLENAWAGKMLLSSEHFAAFLIKLLSLKDADKESVLNWGKKLSAVIDTVPDGHSVVLLNGKKINRSDSRTTSIGGSAVAKETAWKLDWFLINKQKILVFSSHRFPVFSDETWDNFKNLFPLELKKSDGFIIDVRDHNGGDSDPGFWIASHLWGGTFEFPAKIFHMTTPLAYALNFNRYQFEDIMVQPGVSKNILNKKMEYLEKFVLSLRTDASKDKYKLINKESYFGVQNSKDNLYKKPVFFIANCNSGSAAEMFLLSLKNHPNVLVVGENTAGVTHFGNAGRLQLPHSRIVLELSTVFKRHNDGSFVEIVGHRPDIYTPIGQDALLWVKKNMLRGDHN